MRNLFWTLLSLAVVVELYSILPPHYPEKSSEGVVSNYVLGAIDVHSRHGEGLGAIDDIAHQASEAGLDFVVINDTGTSKARALGEERNYGRTDVFVEMEVPTQVGHLLAFYSHTKARSLSDSEVAALAWRHLQGSGRSEYPELFTITAHPSHIRSPWNALDRAGDGTEVMNFDSAWRRTFDESILGFTATTLLYPFNNFAAFLRIPPLFPKDALAWDAMNTLSSNRVGIVGNDVRGGTRLPLGLTLFRPSYRQTFRLMSNAVFLDRPPEPDFEARKKQIYQSISGGRVAMVSEILHPFAGNDWWLRCGSKEYRSGETVPGAANCHFVTRAPSDFPYALVYKLYKNGELVTEWSGKPSELKMPEALPPQGPGAYRLEVWARTRSLFRILVSDDVPYVFYNPIFVK